LIKFCINFTFLRALKKQNFFDNPWWLHLNPHKTLTSLRSFNKQVRSLHNLKEWDSSKLIIRLRDWCAFLVWSWEGGQIKETRAGAFVFAVSFTHPLTACIRPLILFARDFIRGYIMWRCESALIYSNRLRYTTSILIHPKHRVSIHSIVSCRRCDEIKPFLTTRICEMYNIFQK